MPSSESTSTTFATPAPPTPWTSSPPDGGAPTDESATEADVLVIGGGIAGVAAALRLKDRGLTPLVLEREERVGGRMTTDRVEGFAIDRGVTLLGNQFVRMRALCRRFGLDGRAVPAPFSFGLREADARTHGFRAGRVDDILLCSPLLSARARAAFLRLAADLLRNGHRLAHGRGERATRLDDRSAAEYFRGLGAGGEELFDRLLMPGIRGPVGGDPAGMSRAVLFQVFWNILVRGTWNLSGGVDSLPETLAARVPVRTDCRVMRVRRDGAGVCAEAQVRPERRVVRFRARAAVFAVPGDLVPSLCPDLPDWIVGPLARTEYAPMVSAHVALSHPPDTPYPGFSFAPGVEDGVEIEMEHVRAPENCPPGQAMASLYFYPDASGYQAMDDANLRQAAVRLIERVFPECRGAARFVHIVRWERGIARFPPGRLTEMARLRERLRTFDQPFDFCGDYGDGIASEAALRTGEQAADRLARRIRQVRSRPFSRRH